MEGVNQTDTTVTAIRKAFLKAWKQALKTQDPRSVALFEELMRDWEHTTSQLQQTSQDQGANESLGVPCVQIPRNPTEAVAK
jgi:hypothetical protein